MFKLLVILSLALFVNANSLTVQNGEIKDIDRLEYPIQLGHEVFNTGKISFESLKEISSIF